MADQNSGSHSGGEFDIIAKYFRPLSKGSDGALGLLDDAAILDVPDGQSLIVTTDAVVAGVHFLESLSPEDIAHKVVGVNLSDLAAMGAIPKAVFLAAQFTSDLSTDWISAFANGLQSALKPSGAVLMGGDTVSTPGPMAFTITALGHAPKGRALHRANAKPGDVVFTTGTIGDGALGLAMLLGEVKDLSSEHAAHLARRYARPEPRWTLGAELLKTGLTVAAVDVSDGLVADIRHICEASNVDAVIEAEQVPVSEAARAVLEMKPELFNTVLTGGDDYELVFTAPQDSVADIESMGEAQGLQITAIGRIEEPGTLGQGRIAVVDAHGIPLELGAGGYQHL